MSALSNNRIARDFLSLFSGRLFGAGVNFLVMMLLLNRLSVSEFGQFTYFFALMGALQLVLDVGMDNSFVALSSSQYAQDRAGYDRSEITFLNLKYLIGALCLAVALGTLAVKQDLLLFTVMLSSVPLGLADTLLTFLRVKGEFKTVGALVAVINVMRFAVVGLLALSETVHIDTVMYGYALSNLAYFGICYARARLAKWHSLLDREILKAVFSMTKWLFLYNISILFMMRMEVFFLKLYSADGAIAEAELGVYGAAFRLAFFLPLITNSLTAALLPKVSQMKSQGEIDAYLRRIPSMILPVAAVFAASYFASGPLIHYGFSGKYDPSIVIFQLILFGVACTVFTNSLMLLFYSTKQLNLLVILSTVQLVANVLLDLFLIQSHGALGAGWAMVVVRVIGLVLVGYFVMAKLRFKPEGDLYAAKNSADPA